MHDAQFEHIEWSPEIPHVSHFCSASFKKHLYNFCLTKTFGLCLLVRNTSPFFWGGSHSRHQASTWDPGFFRCRTPQAKSETTSNMIRTPHEVRKNSSTVNRFTTIFTGCCQVWGHDYDCMELHVKAQPRHIFRMFFFRQRSLKWLWRSDISLFKSSIYKYDNPFERKGTRIIFV